MSLKIKEALLEWKKAFDVDTKNLQEIIEKETLAINTKANEVMNTWATAFGAELIPTNVMQDGLEMIPAYSSLMAELPWNQGVNLPISAEYPIIGEANLMTQNAERTTGAGITTPANNWPLTSKVVITQWPLKTTVSISKRELNYSSVTDLESKLMMAINKTAARTFDSNLINGDSAVSGNVNLDGGTPSGFAYLGVPAGIRKSAIADSNTTTIGTLTEASFIKVKKLLNNGYASDYQNLLRIMPQNIYDQCLLIDSLITQDKSEFNTFGTGKFGRIFGINVTVARDRPALTASNGKVSSTSGDNTLGSFGLIYKPAVQYGFGQELEIEPEKVPWQGINYIATAEMWSVVVYDKSGLGKTVGLWVWVTLS